MSRVFFTIVLSVLLFFSGCMQKNQPNDTIDQETVIFDISGTYEAFTKTYFPINYGAEKQEEMILLDYGTITPNKKLITDVIYDGTNINFTPITDQGIGTAWITLIAEGKEQTTYIKIYDLSRQLVSIDFDDGPSEFTDDILDTLTETGFSATFFVTGKAYQDVRRVYVGAELYPETLKREAMSGHQIGNHTYDHPWRIMDYDIGPPDQQKDWMDYSRSEVREQVKRLDNLVFDLVGVVPEYFAPPYGRDVHLKAIKKNIPDRSINCNDTGDWIPETTAEEIAQRILATPDNATVLMHDVYQKTAAGLRKALTSAEAEKFQFMTTYELDMIRGQTRQ